VAQVGVCQAAGSEPAGKEVLCKIVRHGARRFFTPRFFTTLGIAFTMTKAARYFSLAASSSARRADVAQLVEQSIRNRQVIGSSPIVGSIFFRFRKSKANHKTTRSHTKDTKVYARFGGEMCCGKASRAVGKQKRKCRPGSAGGIFF